MLNAVLNAIKNAVPVVFGNRVFQVPAAPYVGNDSVLRLGPIDYHHFMSDIAGGGECAGYGVWQGAPTRIVLMGAPQAVVGGGVASGTQRQPGQLLNLNHLDPTSPLSTGN